MKTEPIPYTREQVRAFETAWNSIAERKVSMITKTFHATHYTTINSVRDIEKVKGVTPLTLERLIKSDDDLAWFFETLELLEAHGWVICYENDITNYQRNQRLRHDRLISEQTSEEAFDEGSGKLPTYNIKYYQKHIPLLSGLLLSDLQPMYQYLIVSFYKKGTLTPNLVQAIFTKNQDELNKKAETTK